MFKKLLIAALLLVTTACTSHHGFMDRAVVGYVDGGSQPVVMFPVGVRNGVMLYKPQFSSDCGKVYNSDYQADNTTTNCYVRESRINGLHSYNQHIGKDSASTADTNPAGLEGANSPSHIPDNI
ncbi:hypothetical protein [Rahnella sp. EDr1-12]|uniref:hypothetical protein n=1 Tax=unclassified Rahnella TaxID=2635087 RepID=UPI003BA906F3